MEREGKGRRAGQRRGEKERTARTRKGTKTKEIRTRIYKDQYGYKHERRRARREKGEGEQHP